MLRVIVLPELQVLEALGIDYLSLLK